MFDDNRGSSGNLLSEEESRRIRFSTRSIVRYGPKVSKVSPGGYGSVTRSDSPSASSSTRNQVGSVEAIEPLRGEPSVARGPAEFEDFACYAGRRLRIEYTFVQLSENNLETALQVFNAARRLRGSRESQASAVFRAATLVNQVHKELGPKNSQLHNILVAAAANVPENVSWKLFNPDCLSPSRAAQLLRTKRAPGAADHIHFETGLWAGRTFSLSAMLQLDLTGWAALIPVFVTHSEQADMLLDLMEDPHTSWSDIQLAEEQLARGFSDHWALNSILTFRQYDDESVTIVQRLPPGNHLELSTMLTIVDKVGLSADQVLKCQQIRSYAQSTATAITTSDACIQDMLDDLVDAAPSKQSNGEILDCVEALRQNNLKARMLEVDIAHKLLFNILRPIQAAKLATWIRLSVPHTMAYWSDWMRVLYLSIAGPESWVDKYECPSWMDGR